MKATAQATAIILILLVVGGFFLWKSDKLPFAKQEVYQGCEVKSGLKLVPLIGYYSCEPQGYQFIDNFQVPDTAWYSPGDEWTLCCNYNMQSCTFNLKKGGDTLAADNAVRGSCVTYKKDSFLTGQRNVEVYGDPFALVRYSPTSSPEKVNVVNCRLPSTSNLLKKIVSYVGSGSLSTVINPTDSLDFNQKSSFLADWAVSPVEANYIDGKWCASGGYLYSTQTVEMISGCYAVPNLNTVIEKKIGCPGEPCSIGGRAGVVDTSFNCIQKEGSQCSILNPCSGQGRYNVDWNRDSSGKTAVVYSCVGGYCEPQWKASECASDSACPAGQGCQFDYASGIGVCKERGTTPIPPPVVPPPKLNKDWSKYLVILLPTALGFLILYAMKKDIFWGLVGAILGLIVGLIFYWIMNLPWYVKLLGGVGGGALVYFIGPALVAVIIPILFRRK